MAVFRHEMNSAFHDNFSAKSRDVLFLSIDGRDPHDHVMQSLQDFPVPLKKASQCSQSMRGVVDQTTGKRGAVLRIDRVRWLSRNVAEVKGGYFSNGHSATGNL